MHNKTEKSVKVEETKWKSSKVVSFKMRNKTEIKSLQMKFPHIWQMTSKNFHTDSNARLDSTKCHLKDVVTMGSFHNAICYNRHLIVGRIVLVLHCGQDLLFSLWAAKTGAAHVYAVDSSFAVEYLQAVVKANNLTDRITILQGCIQEIKLPVEKVDVIICNWMGYSLLLESKLDTVIYARDKWLKKDTGIIFPDKAQLYVVGIENSKHKNERVNWWRDVYGFNMKALREETLKAPSFQKIHPHELLTAPVKIWKIDIYKATKENLQFRTPFKIDILRGGSFEGILTFFDVQFSKSHTSMELTTSPWSPQTNWLQSVFYFDDPLTVNVNDKFYCGVVMSTTFDENSNSKATNIFMELFTGTPDDLSLAVKMDWRSSQEIQSITDVDMLTPDKKRTKKVNKKETKELPEVSILKQPKKKSIEKKRKFSKKVPVSIYFS